MPALARNRGHRLAAYRQCSTDTPMAEGCVTETQDGKSGSSPTVVRGSAEGDAGISGVDALRSHEGDHDQGGAQDRQPARVGEDALGSAVSDRSGKRLVSAPTRYEIAFLGSIALA